MQLLKFRVEGLSLYKEPLEIQFVSTQKNTRNSVSRLNEVKKPVYTVPVIEFTGLNASGKTVTLELVEFVLNLISGNNINNSGFDRIKRMINQKTHFEIFYYCGGFYRLKTDIEPVRGRSDAADSPCLKIIEEKLYKRVKKTVTKADWDKSSEYKLELDRTRKNSGLELLLEGESMNRAVYNKISRKPVISNCSAFTDSERLFSGNREILPEICRYLDPSIEKLKLERNKYSGALVILLKFFGGEEIVINTPKELVSYLSSGTIKGIDLFSRAVKILKSGGYLLIDEIENHFNHEIVKKLVDLFMDPEMNIGKGTLIFTTHYPTLMDVVDRNDCIYVFKNNGGFTCEPVSKYLKRTDGMKISNYFEYDFFEGTAPSYDNYWSMYKKIGSLIRGE